MPKTSFNFEIKYFEIKTKTKKNNKKRKKNKKTRKKNETKNVFFTILIAIT